mmetsp:Transcript_37503/g.97009  ORF Transcript_37503/g.97009 Transcript_37503/m.97009 type:complete len:209 (-) Transcript_37503:526-1152(-)
MEHGRVPKFRWLRRFLAHLPLGEAGRAGKVCFRGHQGPERARQGLRGRRWQRPWPLRGLAARPGRVGNDAGRGCQGQLGQGLRHGLPGHGHDHRLHPLLDAERVVPLWLPAGAGRDGDGPPWLEGGGWTELRRRQTLLVRAGLRVRRGGAGAAGDGAFGGPGSAHGAHGGRISRRLAAMVSQCLLFRSVEVCPCPANRRPVFPHAGGH